MSDDRADWPQDASGPEAAGLATPSLAEPAQWLDPSAPGSAHSADRAEVAPRAGSTTVKLSELARPAEANAGRVPPGEGAYSQETLAELAPAPDARLWEEVTAEHSVHALRSLLLGGDAPDLDARLAALERRLDALAAGRANGSNGGNAVGGPNGASSEARWAQIEQRLDTLTSRLDDVYDSARAGDVTLDSLSGLQRQLEELRLDHVHATTSLAQQIKQADDRCRLRQRRARIASRPELRRLRRRLYAQGLRVPGRGSPVVIPGATPVQGPRGAVHVHAYARASAQMAHRMQPDLEPAAGEDTDLRGAWRAVSGSGMALMRALFVLIGLLARLAWEDLRAAWQHLTDLFHSERE